MTASTWVLRRLECPIILAMLSIDMPEITMFTPNGCLATCAVRFSLIPKATPVSYTHLLAVHIVIVVLAIVRHCKGCIIILNNLQLLDIFLLIVNRKSISLTTCILNAAWVRTIRVEVTNLADYSLTANIDVLGVTSALVGNEVRRYKMCIRDRSRRSCSFSARRWQIVSESSFGQIPAMPSSILSTSNRSE